jgi:hypothetical protein
MRVIMDARVKPGPVKVTLALSRHSVDFFKRAANSAACPTGA